jgi:asparagine synthase (glutamine-hydrolysing)
MCGIAGLINKKGNADEQVLVQMTDAIKHRGPDGFGFRSSGTAAIGHRRLSIIDLEGGKQPLCNEDGTVWISFNGEIYNFMELKHTLVQKGHVFQTHSDTEVIVHAYEEWGVDCVTHLRGMFAFAIMDESRKELFLARDHFGIKPLVYAESDSVFCFASELQALRKVPGIDYTIDAKALDQYLQFQYIPAPNSIYKEAKKLMPAHYLRVGFDGTIKELKPYWQFRFRNGVIRTAGEWKEELEAVIKESVKAHLVSDVPFGAFLSGGIDSSAVVAYMAQQMQQPVKTFSIGFKEEKYNELSYARIVAKRWQTDHYEEIVEPDALAVLPQLAKHYGEPFGDSSAIPTWYVCRLAKRHVTMALTGDAGDELFAGYQTYTSRWSKHISPVPNHLTGFKKWLYPVMHRIKPSKYQLRTATLNDWLRYIHYYNDASRLRLWKKELQAEFANENRLFIQTVFDEAAGAGHFQKVQTADFHTYLPGDILTKVDIASMMHSLETRTPLLDLKVVELAATIPQELNIAEKTTGWEGKLLFKEVLQQYYPQDFIYRSKMGFGVPIEHWFGTAGSKRKEVTDRLLSSGNGLDAFFETSELKAITESNNSGQQWLLLFLQEWLQQTK